MTYSITNNTVDTISISLNDLDSEINTNSASGTFSITGNTSPYDYNYTWNSASPLITTGTDTITLGNWNNVLDVNGDANFEGDVKIKGKSIVESLEKIEEKLAILHPNVELEKKWEQLRELRKQYMELEKEIIEKEKVWDILKK